MVYKTNIHETGISTWLINVQNEITSIYEMLTRLVGALHKLNAPYVVSLLILFHQKKIFLPRGLLQTVIITIKTLSIKYKWSSWFFYVDVAEVSGVRLIEMLYLLFCFHSLKKNVILKISKMLTFYISNFILSLNPTLIYLCGYKLTWLIFFQCMVQSMTLHEEDLTYCHSFFKLAVPKQLTVIMNVFCVKKYTQTLFACSIT